MSWRAFRRRQADADPERPHRYVTPGDEQRWTHAPFGADVVGSACTAVRGGYEGWSDGILGAVRAVRAAGIRLNGSVQVQSVIARRMAASAPLPPSAGHTGDAVIICERRGAVIPAHAGVTIFGSWCRAGGPRCVRRKGSARSSGSCRSTAPSRRSRGAKRTVRHPLYEGMALPGRSVSASCSRDLACDRPEQLIARSHRRGNRETIEKVRRQLEATVEQAAQADPFLRDHPPTVEWIGGVWEPSDLRR